MYFTMAEIELLLWRKNFRDVQEQLASIRRAGGDERLALSNHRKATHQLARAQTIVDNERQDRAERKQSILNRLA